ncbi:MAG: efflux RND transporter periplasmic adaptor subunit [Ignavibacteriales bacterium]|nr:efflux RND transporter periplasmic adaptor subunit [Ignavibacteriales bacterium]
MEAQNADLSALRIQRTNNDDQPQRRFNYRYLIGIVITFLVISAGVYLFQKYVVASSTTVRLTIVGWTSPSQTDAVLTASGYVVAQRKASVASKGTGRLAYLGVVEGDRVRKDQVIARLEDSDIVAQLDQARATLKVYEADVYDAETTLKRTKQLLERNLASQAEFDAADARVRRVHANMDVAKASISGAEGALENMKIRAPFDGTVLTKNADVGEIVAPFAASASSRAAVVMIADMSSLEVEADVSEANIVRITPNQACEISLDAYTDKRYQGYVSKIVPTADRAKATVLVKVAFKTYDSRVLPEMSAKVLFLTKASDPSTLNQKPKLTVPASSIVTRGGRQLAFRIMDNRAAETIVTTGEKIGTLVEILSGLSAGEKVVTDVDETITNGTKVKVE